MSKITIGIDNGATGTIALMGSAGTIFETMPSKPFLAGKSGKVVTRVDHEKLRDIIEGSFDVAELRRDARAYVERPFTGSSMMVNTMVLSARSFEAVIIVLEQLGIGFEVVDSKEWQRSVLGAVTGGSAELKRASKMRGIQLYPAHAQAITSHGDADGLLIAHHFHHR